MKKSPTAGEVEIGVVEDGFDAGERPEDFLGGCGVADACVVARLDRGIERLRTPLNRTPCPIWPSSVFASPAMGWRPSVWRVALGRGVCEVVAGHLHAEAARRGADRPIVNAAPMPTFRSSLNA